MKRLILYTLVSITRNVILADTLLNPFGKEVLPFDGNSFACKDDDNGIDPEK